MLFSEGRWPLDWDEHLLWLALGPRKKVHALRNSFAHTLLSVRYKKFHNYIWKYGYMLIYRIKFGNLIKSEHFVDAFKYGGDPIIRTLKIGLLRK